MYHSSFTCEHNDKGEDNGMIKTKLIRNTTSRQGCYKLFAFGEDGDVGAEGDLETESGPLVA